MAVVAVIFLPYPFPLNDLLGEIFSMGQHLYLAMSIYG
jgi:hypothetical protein